MTRIGVISDTHLYEMDPGLAGRVGQAWGEVSLALHAGDLVRLSVLDGLPAPRVEAVCGNMDDHVIAQSLPDRKVVTVEGKRIGLIHGWGSPMGLAGRVAEVFDGVDAIVFGHSHRPMNAVKNGVLFFNPGSASRNFFGGASVGVLSVGPEGISGEIIKL